MAQGSAVRNLWEAVFQGEVFLCVETTMPVIFFALPVCSSVGLPTLCFFEISCLFVA